MKIVIEPDKMAIVVAGTYLDATMSIKNALKVLKLRCSLFIHHEIRTLHNYLAAEAETPHLIFLDGGTCVEDSLECLRQIRKDVRFMETSIALFTDTQNDETLTAYYRAGANICIRTPESPHALEKIITQVVHLNWQYVTNGLDREKFILKY